ncbi:cytidine deaminase [Actinomyces howellii]|uniref:Cytidine deaminase n=1 Tax=Actinomyces howellii TaxID=52771 RepID=A0A448HFN6_9ACTO|nr:Cytidine deaminase [Actinomyces howellii]
MSTPTTPGPRPPRIDESVWHRLRELAVEAMGRAYVPYSHFPVGAAALVEDGRLVSGCNVENAGYGVTLCAECGLVSELVRTGGGRLVAFVCVDARGAACAPCGRCRQLLSEHAHPAMVLAMPSGRASIDQVLPDRFTEADLDAVLGDPAARPVPGPTGPTSPGADAS